MMFFEGESNAQLIKMQTMFYCAFKKEQLKCVNIFLFYFFYKRFRLKNFYSMRDATI